MCHFKKQLLQTLLNYEQKCNFLCWHLKENSLSMQHTAFLIVMIYIFLIYIYIYAL